MNECAYRFFKVRKTDIHRPVLKKCLGISFFILDCHISAQSTPGPLKIKLVKYMHLKIECNEKIKLENKCQRNCTEMKEVAWINQDGTVLVDF